MFGVSDQISAQFRSPIVPVGRWDDADWATWLRMLVPKAPMHKNGFSPSWERQIGLPRQSFGMKAVSIAASGEIPSNNQLGLSVFTPNSTHDATARLCGEPVSHQE